MTLKLSVSWVKSFQLKKPIKRNNSKESRNKELEDN